MKKLKKNTFNKPHLIHFRLKLNFDQLNLIMGCAHNFFWFVGWTHVIRGALVRLKLKVIGFAMEKKIKNVL